MLFQGRKKRSQKITSFLSLENAKNLLRPHPHLIHLKIAVHALKIKAVRKKKIPPL